MDHLLVDHPVMCAWQIRKYKGINSLEFITFLKHPKIREPTEVLIEVMTTSINSIDARMSYGYGRRLLDFWRWTEGRPELPITLGRDFCGIIKDVGSAVDFNLKIGDTVWGVIEPHQSGSFAEFIVVDQKYITHKPRTMDEIGAGSFLYCGLTAWSSFYWAGLFGKRNSPAKVCVLGAAGGVGTIAVQIAKVEKAHVTATCATDAVELVKSLGVDRVIDYAVDDVEDELHEEFFDIILDCAGLGPKYALEMPWKYRKYVTLEPPILSDTDASGLFFGTIRSIASLVEENIRSLWYKRGIIQWGIFRPSRKGIEYLKKQADANRIRPVVDTIFEFESADKAIRKLAEGHLRGKIVLNLFHDFT